MNGETEVVNGIEGTRTSGTPTILGLAFLPLTLTTIPIVGLATLSVIIHASVASKMYREKAAYQISLLLCLILASSNQISNISAFEVAQSESARTMLKFQGDVITMSHLPAIFSLADIFISHALLGNHCAFTFLGRHHSSLKLCIRSLVPSSLVLLYTTILIIVSKPISLKVGYDGAKLQAISFLTSWILFILFSIRKRRQLIVGTMPLTIPNGRGLGIGVGGGRAKPDERTWENWTTNQFLDWVRCKYTECLPANSNSTIFSNGISSSIVLDCDEVEYLLDTLKVQSINGESLGYIQLKDLTSMGISFGHSVMLVNEIGYMISKFPSRTESRRQRYSGRVQLESAGDGAKEGAHIDLDEWLGKKIGGASGPRGVNTEETSDASNDTIMPNHGNDGIVFGMDGTTAARSKDMMGDRFGSTLPDLRNRGNNHNIEGNASVEAFGEPKKAQIQNPFDTIEIDQSLLDAMPANVRAIASRRPELVQAILSQGQHQPKSSLTAGSGAVRLSQENNSSFQNGKTTGLDTEDFTRFSDALDVIDEESGEWERGEHNGSSSETVGLLRRRRKNVP